MHIHAPASGDALIVIVIVIVILIFSRSSPDTAERDLGAGRTQAAWSGTSGRRPRERR